MRKEQLTRELLESNNIWVEFDENNQPKVKQLYIPTASGLPQYSSRWMEDRSEIKITTKHKYGKDMTYKAIVVKIDGKPNTITLQNIVWVWCKGKIKPKHDIDHIDDDPMNNSIDNLQMISRKENLNKRKSGIKNQHDVINYEKWGQLYLDLKNEWKATRRTNETFDKWYNNRYKTI